MKGHLQNRFKEKSERLKVHQDSIIKTVELFKMRTQVYTRWAYCHVGFVCVLAFASFIASCDSSSRSPKSDPGWTTNCQGPMFNPSGQSKNAGTGNHPPVFRINDDLVIAIPRSNWPTAKINKHPAECRKIVDVPLAQFVTFELSGNWSKGYRPQDIPIVGGSKQFVPDKVAIRIEREFSALSPAEEERRQLMLRENAQKEEKEMIEIGGLTCFDAGGGWHNCFGKSGVLHSDFTRLGYRTYAATPFVLALADYPSSRYGGIHVFWKTWTLDPKNVPDIDSAIWKALEDWNLVYAANAALSDG